MALGYSSWEDYYERGLIPNIWKGITGQTSADRNTDKANQANIDIAKQTNASNERIAQENLAFQRENLDYQKALQQQIFEREDTSYKRTANDMLSAGLNPLTMQGTNGAGEVISTSPLNNSMQYQMPAAQIAAQNMNQGLTTLMSFMSGIGSIKDGILQRDAIQLENDRKKLENTKMMQELGLTPNQNNKKLIKRYKGSFLTYPSFYGMSNDTFGSYWINNIDKRRELNHKINAGIFDTDLREERILTALTDWIDNGRLDKLFESMKKHGSTSLFNLFGN